ncbi:MAG: hypothetical protein ACRD1U_01175 [Vicinamibacterales bacterium]
MSREQLVAKLAGELESASAPRLQLFAIVTIAGAAAFLTSALLYRVDVETLGRMWVRYPVAGLAGYVVFLLLIRLWIAIQRRGDGFRDGIGDVAGDLLDPGLVPNFGIPRADDGLSGQVFGGGHSGGAGASHAFGSPLFSASRGRVASHSSTRTGGWSLDLDDFAWLLVAVACALGGLFAIAYVVYIAPVLLAEVALDAALVSALYHACAPTRRAIG